MLVAGCRQTSCVPTPFHPVSPLLDGRDEDGNTFAGYFPAELLPLLGMGDQVCWVSKLRSCFPAVEDNCGTEAAVTSPLVSGGAVTSSPPTSFWCLAWKISHMRSRRAGGRLRGGCCWPGGGITTLSTILARAVPVPCRCHAVPPLLLAHASRAQLFIVLLPPGVFIQASSIAGVQHRQRTGEMLPGFRSEE